MIDTSAFDRFKKEAEPKLPNQIDLSAFGYKWKEPVDIPKLPEEPKGLVKTMAPELARSAWEGAKDWYQKEREIRRDMNPLQKKIRNVTEPAKFALTMTRYIAGSISSLGKSALEFIYAPVFGEDYVRQQLSEPKFEKVFYKDETKSYQQMKEGIDKYTAESTVATPWEKKYLGTTLALGTFAADAWPGKPNPKKGIEVLIKDLVEETTEAGAKKKLVEFGVEKTVAERIARGIPAANEESAVIELIQRETQATLTDIAKTVPSPVEKVVDEAAPNPVRPDATDTSLAARATSKTAEVTEELLTWARGTRAAGIQRAGRKNFNEATKVLQRAGELPTETKMDKVTTDSLKEFYTTKKPPVVGDTFINRKGERVEIVKVNDTSIEYFLAGKKKGISGTVTFDKSISEVWEQSRVKAAEAVASPTTAKTGIPDTAPKVNYKGEDIKVNDVLPEQKLKATDEELGALKDMAKRDASRLQPVRATGEKTGRDLAEEIIQREKNFESKMTDQEIAKIREENLLGPETIDEIILRKRGIISDGMAIDRAKRISGTLEDVINLPRGTAATTEQMRAIRQIVAEEEEINKALKNLIDNGGLSSTPAERRALERLGEGYDKMPESELLRRAYQESTYKLKKAQIVEMALGSEAGRTLSGLRKVGDAFDSRMRTLINRLDNNKKFTDEEKSAMIDVIAKLDVRDNQLFLKTLEDIVKPDMFDKVAEWSVAAKLWNPTTHVVNFAGNTLRQITDIALTAITNPTAAVADMHGAIVGFKQGLKNALRAMTDEGYAAQLAKYVETGGTAPAIGGKLGKWVRTPFRALGASDEIFKTIGYQRKLYRDAHAIAKKEELSGKQLEARMTELLNAPTFKMMEDATDAAKHLTFQDDMGEIMTKIERFRNPAKYKTKAGKTVGVGVRFFLPFLKTPTNLFKQSMDFSPIGLIKNFNTIKKGGEAGKKAVGEAILGTALGAYIIMETLDGNVTGGAPRDTAAKDRFYREKKIPYGIKIGDRWYEYKRIDPFASIIGLTADATTLEEKSIGSIFGVIAENLKDKTYLSGMSDMMKMLTGEDWERDYAVKSMILGAAVPSIIGHTARSMDPTIRQVDTFADRAQALIPTLSDELPARVNVLGYDVERANKGLNYFFNPIQSATATIDPVTRGLMDIDKTVSVPDKSFSRDKVQYDLTPEEYETFARQVGMRLRTQLAEEFRSPRYKRMTTEEKQAQVDAIRREIMDEWKDDYVENKGSRKSLDEIFGQRKSLDEIFGN